MEKKESHLDTGKPVAEDARSERIGGIQEFIAQTNLIGNVIAAAASQKNTFEPLPFPNYSLFDENLDTIAHVLSIHINPNSSSKHIFHPRQPVKVTVKAERKHGPHIFHPYIYTLKFDHAGYTWEVARSYKELKEVHKRLAKLVKADIGRSCSDISKEDIKPDWPLFPTEHDHLITQANIGARCKSLSEYLTRMLSYPPFRDNPEVLAALGVSPLSFINGVSPSLIEEQIQKRTGDNVYYGRLSKLQLCCDNIKVFHASRWFILKDTYLVYLNPELNYQVGFVMLLDRAFDCKMKIRAGAYHAIVVKNLQRTLVLKCRSSQQQREWHEKLTSCMQGPVGGLFVKPENLPYESYAPPRPNQKCRWYVNAQTYMEHVMLALNNAKEEIYITDWWLCPELFLKRPTDDLQYRLDKILLKKAKEGVRVYILLFKEVSFALGLLSSRAKNVLTQNGKNPNIKVLRHPEHTPSGVFLWSHHEKCVIVDQSVAFAGGIDLCFGRWDDDLHRLIDLGRKENVTQIDTSVVVRSPMFDLTNEIRKTMREHQIESEINELRNELERTDTEQQFNIQSTKIEVTDPEEIEKKISELKSEEETTFFIETSPTSTQQATEQNKADALIVAALMGNSIAKFNKLKNAKKSVLQAQLSAPPVSELKPQMSERGAKSDNDDDAKNFQLSDLALRPIQGKKHSITKAASSLSSTNPAESNAQHSKSHGRKASKYLAVPSHDPDETASNASRRDRVKKKWKKFKQDNLKTHKLHRKNKRRPSDSFDSDEISDYLSDDDKGFSEEENPAQPVISSDGYYWIGKDYSNTYKEDFKDIADFSRDQFNRSETPRMPWRDEAFVLIGESARDLARHFIQRWNQCKREKVRHVPEYPFLIPKSYSQPFEYDYESWFKDQLYTCNVQMTRSLDNWSGGLSVTECSVMNAYCDLIRRAEHFIYIENQFFVTTTQPTKDTDVKNAIGQVLVDRIKQAHQQKKRFRVYIVLPLLPGFDNRNAIQAVQYFNLRSINLGEYSIFKELEAAGINPNDYITFHGMRNWTVLMGKLVQEIIYVHSKLMIVDDKYVVCGSANINDRSLLGKRDSEVAAVFKDEEFIDSVLDDKSVKVGRYAHSLRKKIFKLHLGIYFNNPNKVDTNDCVCDEFFNFFRSTSHQNTLVYDSVFKCLPSDNILTFENLASYTELPCLSKTDPIKGKEELDSKINGFIVDFPLKFLSQEKNFFPEINTPEGMVPTAMWT